MPGSDHPLLVSVPLVDPVVKRKMGLIKRRSTVLSPAAQQLYDLCSERQVNSQQVPTTSNSHRGTL
jgi:hypothetical protein